ncbi:hypothetical protein [Bradyrhizobium iriomotense]|uniref:Uncharacterized protein n=1 Tax=Bradyrhizobium iriomotense TaxID=441950 RepID=A0ABQ6B360_9BRAD|nr:hypothetical protein [Bradyrhizobium iriomotense]GLR86507.1 hypothetical protein GCM10007857_32180 [Bradyrhizobium iriomotense]
MIWLKNQGVYGRIDPIRAFGLVGFVRSLTGDDTAALTLCVVLDLVAAVAVLMRPRPVRASG